LKLTYVAFPRIGVGHREELLPRQRHSANFGRNELGQGEYFPRVSSCDRSQARQINTFHWHITDSQSFPLEVAQYPELAINGAYSAEEVYTASDVQYIVQYAAEVCFSLHLSPLVAYSHLSERYRRSDGQYLFSRLRRGGSLFH
jgi:hypothetical protein